MTALAVQPPHRRAGLLPRTTRVLLDHPSVPPSSGSAGCRPRRIPRPIADMIGALDPEALRVVTHAKG
jgi:hypothetical protein